MFLRNVGVDAAANQTIPHVLFFAYQGTFAIITAALISLRGRLLWWPFHPAGFALAHAFLAARFSGAERHVRRVGKIKTIEEDARRGLFDRPAAIAITEPEG